LSGQAAGHTGFTNSLLEDVAIRRLLGLMKLVPDDSMPLTGSKLIVTTTAGDRLESRTSLALGNPGNPMRWEDLDRKFLSLVEPVLGDRAKTLLELLRHLDRQNDLTRVVALLSDGS